MAVPPSDDEREAFWRDYLTRGDAMKRRVRPDLETRSLDLKGKTESTEVIAVHVGQTTGR